MSDYNPIKFPGFRYGPNGQSQIFQSESEVPEGWTDNPNDFKTSNEAVVDVSSSIVEESKESATAPVEAKKPKAKRK